MIVGLEELLALTGRLDDAPGFDTPRERFRRFLLEHVIDLSLAQALIETCQQSVGEQRHRALQDLVVLLGRFLQFETTFGGYEPEANLPTVHGEWRSHGTLGVLIEVRTDQTTDATFENLAHALSTAVDDGRAEIKRIGLCVLSRHYAGRGRLERGATPVPGVSFISVQSILALATHMAAGRLTHADVLKLLTAGMALDVVVELLDRPTGVSIANTGTIDASFIADRHEPAFWVGMIGGNTTAAEQLVASAIARRHVLGTSHLGPRRADAAAGDWVCFFIREKGIVGHAQLAAIVDNGASVVRDGANCARVFQLTHVEIYREPVVQALRAARPFALPSFDVPLAAPCLMPIARHDFIALTKDQPDAIAS